MLLNIPNLILDEIINNKYKLLAIEVPDIYGTTTLNWYDKISIIRQTINYYWYL